MTLAEILKSKGWSDEQIATATADKNLASTLEASFGELITERDQLKARDAEWQEKLDKEWQPRVSEYEKNLIETRKELALAKELNKIAKDYGYLDTEEAKKREEDARAAAAAASDPGRYDPKRHPTFEDVARFADGEAEAIALATDLAAEYQHLYGKSLFEYETQVNGQSMRGMRALRQEAKAQRKPLDQYVAEKFDFTGKRKALAEQRQTERDQKIAEDARADERRKLAEQYGNPNLRNAVPSRHPFMPPKPADGKQPWERGSAQQRRSERLQHALDVQLNAGRTVH